MNSGSLVPVDSEANATKGLETGRHWGFPEGWSQNQRFIKIDVFADAMMFGALDGLLTDQASKCLSAFAAFTAPASSIA
jgi:hypothetical protein